MGGTFQLEAQDPLDYEEKASYAVTVTATDSDGNSATLPVTVTVTPIDEMPAVSGSGAGCEENSAKTGYDCEYAENGTPVRWRRSLPLTRRGTVVSWDVVSTSDNAVSDRRRGLHASRRTECSASRPPPTMKTRKPRIPPTMYVVIVQAADNAYEHRHVPPARPPTKTVTVDGDERGGAWEGDAHRQRCDPAPPSIRCCSRRWVWS